MFEKEGPYRISQLNISGFIADDIGDLLLLIKILSLSTFAVEYMIMHNMLYGGYENRFAVASYPPRTGLRVSGKDCMQGIALISPQSRGIHSHFLVKLQHSPKAS